MTDVAATLNAYPAHRQVEHYRICAEACRGCAEACRRLLARLT
jgi:hypothetical protein